MDSTITTSICKAEPDSELCRCCLSKGSSYKNLKTPYFCMDNEKVVYIDMLRECFNIELIEVSDSSQQMLYMICYTCIQRLEDALKFKQQIQKCEKKFQQVYIRCLTKVTAFELLGKQAVLDGGDDLPAFNRPSEEAIIVKEDPLKNDDDDDDGCNDYDDDTDDDPDYKPPEDEKDAVIVIKDEAEESERKGRRNVNLAPEGVSSTKSVAKKKRKTTATKVKKKRGRKPKVKDHPEAPDDEESLEYIDGKAVVILKTKTTRINIDFKITEDGYQCLQCPVVAKNSTQIRSHIRVIHFKFLKYKCPTCFESFKFICTLIKHKFEEHGIDERYKCNACHKTFFDKPGLHNHVQVFHMQGEVLKCPECKFETRNKQTFTKHKVKHSTEKNFVCQTCLKAFKRKDKLSLHERIHTGDKRKVCQECGRAFIDRTSLKYHMVRHHPGVDF